MAGVLQGPVKQHAPALNPLRNLLSTLVNFAYSTNYLIDLKIGMIVDVKASAVTKTAEVEATKILIRIDITLLFP